MTVVRHTCDGYYFTVDEEVAEAKLEKGGYLLAVLSSLGTKLVGFEAETFDKAEEEALQMIAMDWGDRFRSADLFKIAGVRAIDKQMAARTRQRLRKEMKEREERAQYKRLKEKFEG